MKIDFYILEQTGKQQSHLFACKLIEKINSENKSIYIHTDSKDEAEKIDKLLWTYKDDGFLPHHLVQEQMDKPAAIQIGYTMPPNHFQDILLNLQTDLPTFHNQFNHIIEIVFHDPTVQQLARERYRQYRDLGYELNTHKIKATDL